MKSKQNYLGKFKIPIIIVILLILTEFTTGFISGFTSAKEKSIAIIEVLENNCDCKEIKQSIYLKGIQFSKEGISKEKGEFQLIDCNFESLEVEVNRINEILNKEVKNFNEVDQLRLEFINSDVSQSVVIKNGVIQKP